MSRGGEFRELRVAVGEVYPQVVHMGPGYDWDAPDSVARVGTEACAPERLNLEAFHLDPDAQLTDLVDQGYIYAPGLLVSAAFAGVLAAFALQSHIALRAGVVQDGVRHDYRWLHFVDEAERQIDYRQSRITGADAPIESPEALAAAARRVSEHPTGTLRTDRLVFVPGTPGMDLFCVQLAPRRFFVSEAVAAALTASRMTGFEIGPERTDVMWVGG